MFQVVYLIVDERLINMNAIIYSFYDSNRLFFDYYIFSFTRKSICQKKLYLFFLVAIIIIKII